MALDPGHPQYGEMVSRMGSEGGFTYNPRFDRYETEGFAVSPYPQHEAKHDPAESTPARMASFHAEHDPLLSEAPHMIGGWRNTEEEGGTKDYLDVSKVYPPTGGGQTAARYQSIKHNQKASMNLATFEEDTNPFHNPLGSHEEHQESVREGTSTHAYPEFSLLASSGATMSQIMKRSPEIAAWTQSPSRRESFARQQSS